MSLVSGLTRKPARKRARNSRGRLGPCGSNPRHSGILARAHLELGTGLFVLGGALRPHWALPTGSESGYGLYGVPVRGAEFMTALNLRYEACVKSLPVRASCTTCRDTCPTAAISFDGPRGTVQVLLADCTQCGLCAAACPTDAFDAPFGIGAFVKGTGASRSRETPAGRLAVLFHQGAVC